MTDADEPRHISPFKIIRQGEDTVDGDENLVFSDFRPQVMSADVPEPLPVVAPKEESAPVPVPSSESTQTTGPTESGTIVPAPADEADGKPSLPESLKPTSSSVLKPGQSAQPA